MKKFLFLLPLLILGFIAEADAQIQNERPIKIKVKFTLIIAAKRLDCESGFGFCFSDVGIGGRVATAGLFTENNQLYVCFKRDQLSDGLESELVKLKSFPVEEGTTFPSTISEQLGYRNEITLVPGNYPVTLREDYIVIPCKIE